MKTLAGLALIYSVITGAAAIAISAPPPELDRSLPKLKIERAVVDEATTLKALEQRFGRDTLLYFPVEHGNAPVALQQLVHAR